MDLSTLGSTLPPGLADAERDMGDKFRAAALSITNLYKSSLGYTKQAYNVGYSAALADVLSTVQSSIGAGQDAEQTLSRLMDWADARQAAISAFAAEDTDEVPPPVMKRPTAISKQSLNQLNPHNRPASAPIPNTNIPSNAGPSFASSSSTSGSKLKERNLEDSPTASSSTSRNIQPIASTSNSTTPNTYNSPVYQPTSSGILSSSPMASPSNNRPIFNPLSSNKPSKNLPNRYTQLNLNQNNGSGSTSTATSTLSHNTSSLPSTTFNPSLPSAGIPFVSFTHNQSNEISDGPAQNYSTGSKRPMLDSMEIDQVPMIPSSNNSIVQQIQTPPPITTNSRSGRASKRRSLGNNLNNIGGDGDNSEKDKDKEREKDRDRDRDRERKKGNRRHGNGNGASAV